MDIVQLYVRLFKLDCNVPYRIVFFYGINHVKAQQLNMITDKKIIDTVNKVSIEILKNQLFHKNIDNMINVSLFSVNDAKHYFLELGSKDDIEKLYHLYNYLEKSGVGITQIETKSSTLFENFEEILKKIVVLLNNKNDKKYKLITFKN